MASLPKNILTFEDSFSDMNGRKTDLKASVAAYRQLIEERMENLKPGLEEVGKQALMIGGIIGAVYLVLDALLPDEAPEGNKAGDGNSMVVAHRSEPSSWLTKAVTSYAVTWALGVARQKLMDFLATQQHTNAVKNTNKTSA